MKKSIFALGIFLEVLFLSFYVFKYLKVQWGVQNLFLDDSRVFALTFITLALALVVYFVLGFLLTKYKIPYRYILIFAVVFNLSLLFIWNYASNDLYTHIQRGRMMAKYEVSPYSATYDQFKHDEFYAETRTVWSGQFSIYGPVFTLFGALVSTLARDSLFAHIIIYKLVYALLNILIGYLIYKITKSVHASFLYSWNPLIIFEIQMNNHFELLSVFPIVLALYLLLSKVNWKRYVISISILTLGVLTKFFSLIVYPFYILYVFKKLPTLKQKLLFLFVGGLSQMIILLFAYLPFMDNLGISNFLLLAKGTFINPSLVMFILIKFFEIINIQSHLAQELAQWVFKISLGYLFVKSAMTVKFSQANVFAKTLVIVFALFTLVYLNLILPWYTITLITLLAIYYGLSKQKKYILFVYLTTLYALFLYIRVI